MPSTLTRVAQVYKSGSTDLAYPPAGWVGTLAAIKGDLVRLASGVINPAITVGATIADATRIAVLNDACAASEIPTTNNPVLKGIEKFDDDTLIELPIAISTGGSNTLGNPGAIATPLTALPALVGNQYGISRNTAGAYYVDTAVTTASSCKVEVVALGTRYPTTQNFTTVLCRVLSGARIN